MDHVIALRQISVTAQCYSSILFRRQQENPSSRREGTSIQRHEEKNAPAHGRERERARARTLGRKRERARFGSSFYMFFLHLGLRYADWAQPGVLFVPPEVFTLVLGPAFDLPCFLATAILDSFSLFYLPNSMTVIVKLNSSIPFTVCLIRNWQLEKYEVFFQSF